MREDLIARRSTQNLSVAGFTQGIGKRYYKASFQGEIVNNEIVNKESQAGLLKALVDFGVASGGGCSVTSCNYVVNVAMLLKMRQEIERAFGGEIKDADLFALFANEVMSGGVLVLTDESTTGQAVSVDFHKKITF